jgi:flagellar hook-basal body complex protein FliE
MDNFRIDLSKYVIKSSKPDVKKTMDSYFIDGIKPFELFLTDSMKSVNDLQIESDKLIERLSTGDVDDISEVVLASSRAEVAMRMLMEVRNKLLEAYQQISRIQG